ncbi:MAG: mannose-1-phosphate guanylyltransferase [Acidobacteria bacterium]|nr:mannose-1-phosphate guanylyltransferase [Acidobacteriota bacterium]
MPRSNYYGLILAGGRGTRFWPLSRKSRAKQVLSFFGERTLIQQTVDRLKPVLPPERIWVLTNDHLRDEIVKQLPEVPASQILAEPAQRNTAPAIGLAAQILSGLDPDSVMGVFPADHVVLKPSRFLRFVKAAFKAGAAGNLAVVGIQPRWPETGYGYIEFPKGTEVGGVTPYPVKQFREKPDLKTAKKFVKAGNFSWNAGMFFWRTQTLLEELRTHLPKTATLLAGLPPIASPDFTAKLAELFPRCENVSIDVGVMEKSKRVVGLAADDVGWNDVGSWNAVYELATKDGVGNAVRGEAMFTDLASGNYVNAPGKLVTLIGVKNLVVVDTHDALLIVDREQAQKVGDLVKLIEQQKRHELL